MRITLKLYAGLAKYLPASAVANAIVLEVDEDRTPSDVLVANAVPLEAAHLVLLNGVYLNHTERAERTLTSGDVLAAWPPVAGG